jgi:hypothetical protein
MFRTEHFWNLRCRTSARCCCAKHISKSKVLKTGGLGVFFEVKTSKKCTPSWREAQFEVKMWKAHQVRTTCGRSTAPHYTGTLRSDPLQTSNNARTCGTSEPQLSTRAGAQTLRLGWHPCKAGIRQSPDAVKGLLSACHTFEGTTCIIMVHRFVWK